MSEYSFNWNRIGFGDREIAHDILGWLRQPDLVIAPDGLDPYLLRWRVIPRNRTANVYFHIQLKSDPDRPLHDHPWDNTSVILAGGYNEIIALPNEEAKTVLRATGDCIHRRADTPHRLILPEDVPYTMTLFTTGPHKRDWGFWATDGWVSHTEFVSLEGNKSILTKEIK